MGCWFACLSDVTGALWNAATDLTLFSDCSFVRSGATSIAVATSFRLLPSFGVFFVSVLPAADGAASSLRSAGDDVTSRAGRLLRCGLAGRRVM